MNRRTFTSMLAATPFAAMSSGCGRGTPLPVSRDLVATPEARRAYLDDMLKRICTDLGPHPSGSLEYDRAADIVRGEMAKALPLVELDEYTFEDWRVTDAPLLAVGDELVEAVPAPGCSPTPEGGVRGVLVKRGGGIPYAVVDRPGGDELLHLTVSGYGRAVPLYVGDDSIRCLPRLNVGKQDVALLDEAAENGTPVAATVDVEFVPDTSSCSVVGTRPGKSDREVLVLAHLDTVYPSPGANDNTASMVTMLMLAHALSGEEHPLTMRFVATGGEEYGLLGAKHYADRRAREGTLNRIGFVLNFDSLTYGPDLWIYTLDPELRELITSIDSEMGINGTPKFFEREGFYLDAEPFRQSGALAVNCNSRGYDEQTLKLWHRPEDTPDTVHADCVEGSFLMFDQYLRRIQTL